ncbi:UDP-2,4-diacetamido-2,4,6-trideoxy-beta-L-altropyranose hydrolase [Flavobacteriaceae bacterium]|nr:UDP-2,4-diacetamido-2,4,6-trideoxy-beta-L-altropyranose hydrolase [Flavobacteriaceae bacterium]
MQKEILFRADGNSEIGLGHLYRLFALVEIYKQQCSFTFLTKKDSVLNIIPKDYKVITIPEEININEEPYWIEKNFSPSEYIIIADGYQFISEYQKKIKDLGYFLIYIDDLVKEHMYADIVVNHSPHVFENFFYTENYTSLVLGTNYAMLRPNFLIEAKKPPRNITHVNTVFVNFGGSDSLNLTYKFVESLLSFEQIRSINIVIGHAYKQKEIFILKNKFSKRIKIYKNLSELELIKVMKSSDLAVVPSSTILFELFCIGIPIYSGYFVDNQKQAFIKFKETKSVYGKGDFRKFKTQDFKIELISLFDELDIKSILNNQKNIIDGNQKRRYLHLINKNCNGK